MYTIQVTENDTILETYEEANFNKACALANQLLDKHHQDINADLKNISGDYDYAHKDTGMRPIAYSTINGMKWRAEVLRTS